MTDATRDETALPEVFLDQVKQSLEHLYDFPFLNRHPLARDTTEPIPSRNITTNEPLGHTLRRELIAAIETLNPGHGIGVRSNPARLYNLLHMHYVGGMTVQEAAHDLGISLRQAYRDLRRGHISIGEVLWFHRHGQQPAHDEALHDDGGEDADPESMSSVQSEVERLKDHRAPADITAILDTALRAVGKLAEDQGVRLRLDVPPKPLMLTTNPVAAQQVFISLLSQAVRETDSSTLSVTLAETSGGTGATLELTWDDSSEQPSQPSVVRQLLEALRWSITAEAGRLQITMRATATTLLIVDDNEGLVELLERYFTGLTYEVVSAASGLEGLEMAESAHPDVVMLDLMMPEMDGWEMLQRLRTHPDTRVRALPIVICSVIHDPDLAYSLGASAFVAKPVNKDKLLEALKEVGV